MHKIYNYATGETWAECIQRYGFDTCMYCKKHVPKGWGNSYLGGKFECVACEEIRADAKRDEK